jgi:hypothetical protein
MQNMTRDRLSYIERRKQKMRRIRRDKITIKNSEYLSNEQKQIRVFIPYFYGVHVEVLIQMSHFSIPII